MTSLGGTRYTTEDYFERSDIKGKGRLGVAVDVAQETQATECDIMGKSTSDSEATKVSSGFVV